MSAGDVLFVGWTGSPLTKELTASIEYEPIFVNGDFFNYSNTINKKLIRRIICFDKDKPQVLQQLQFTDASISVPIINANGSIENKSYGRGWELNNINDTIYASGISIITVTYVKKAPKAFEFDLPTGMTVICNNGITSIKYNGHTLESYDNETGSCGTGIQIVPIKYDFDTTQGIDAGMEKIVFEAQLVVDDIVVEKFQLTAGDLPTEKIKLNNPIQVIDISIEKQFTNLPSPAGISSTLSNKALLDFYLQGYQFEDVQSWINENILPTSGNSYTSAVNSIKENIEYKDSKYTTYDVVIEEEIDTTQRSWPDSVNAGDPVINVKAVIKRYAKIYKTITIPDLRYNLASFPPGIIADDNFLFYLSQQKEVNLSSITGKDAGLLIKWRIKNNKLQLYFGKYVWKEYDISGLAPI